MSIKIDQDREQFYADMDCGAGVTVEFVRGHKDDGEWEVWGVRLDGHLYREPRDLNGEILSDGSVLERLRAAETSYLAAKADAA